MTKRKANLEGDLSVSLVADVSCLERLSDESCSSPSAVN